MCSHIAGLTNGVEATLQIRRKLDRLRECFDLFR